MDLREAEETHLELDPLGQRNTGWFLTGFECEELEFNQVRFQFVVIFLFKAWFRLRLLDVKDVSQAEATVLGVVFWCQVVHFEKVDNVTFCRHRDFGSKKVVELSCVEHRLNAAGHLCVFWILLLHTHLVQHIVENVCNHLDLKTLLKLKVLHVVG